MKKMWTGMIAVLGGLAAAAVFGGADAGGAATSASAPATAASTQETAQAIETATTLPWSVRIKAVAEASQDWVKSDPAAAYEWTLRHPDGRFRHLVLNIMVAQWVRDDVAGAVAYITKGSSREGWSALAGNWVIQYPAAATAWAAKQTKARWPAIYGPMGEGWTRKDPAAATAWVDSLPVERGQYAYPLAAASYTWSDPKAAAAWTEKLPACDLRNVAFASVANVWSRKVPGDIDKIKAWVGQLSIGDAEKEKILKGIVMPREKK